MYTVVEMDAHPELKIGGGVPGLPKTFMVSKGEHDEFVKIYGNHGQLMYLSFCDREDAENWVASMNLGVYARQVEAAEKLKGGASRELIDSLDPDLRKEYESAGYGSEAAALDWAEAEQNKRNAANEAYKNPHPVKNKKLYEYRNKPH